MREVDRLDYSIGAAAPVALARKMESHFGPDCQ
jgi:hypothetical protein